MAFPINKPQPHLDAPKEKGEQPAKAFKLEEDELFRPIYLAVNVFDLSLVSDVILANVLRDPKTGGWRIDKDKPVVVDKGKADEQCCPFVCGLLTAALCLDILRNDARQDKAARSVRAYTKEASKGAPWKKMGHNVLFTVEERGVIKLNPKVFPVKIDLEPVTPPPSAGFTMKSRKERK